MNEEMDPTVSRLFERISSMVGIPAEVLAGKWGTWGGGDVSDALSANPQATTAAVVQTAQEEDPSYLPKFLNATFQEMAKHITMADAGGDAIAKNMATTLGGGSLNPVAARKFVESRVAGLLGHHLDKDKWGAQ